MAERDTKHEPAKAEAPKANAGATAKRKDQLGAGVAESGNVIPAVSTLIGQISGQIAAHKGNEDELGELVDELNRRQQELAEAVAEGTMAAPPTN
jgi:hypothetical protein